MNTIHKFELNQPPYPYDALEPFIDKATVEIHYRKHHKAYFINFVNEIAGTDLESMHIEDILKNISHYSVTIRNNCGGYFNHTLYWDNMKAHWQNMKSHGAAPPLNQLSNLITETFGSLAEFKKQFSEKAKESFGSSWVWLCLDREGKLFISTTPNQDNPLMDVVEQQGTPLLALDIWEHAYYLKYQNKRDDYIEGFWNIVDWDKVSVRFEFASMVSVTT